MLHFFSIGPEQQMVRWRNMLPIVRFKKRRSAQQLQWRHQTSPQTLPYSPALSLDRRNLGPKRGRRAFFNPILSLSVYSAVYVPHIPPPLNTFSSYLDTTLKRETRPRRIFRLLHELPNRDGGVESTALFAYGCRSNQKQSTFPR